MWPPCCRPEVCAHALFNSSLAAGVFSLSPVLGLASSAFLWNINCSPCQWFCLPSAPVHFQIAAQNVPFHMQIQSGNSPAARSQSFTGPQDPRQLLGWHSTATGSAGRSVCIPHPPSGVRRAAPNSSHFSLHLMPRHLLVMSTL